MQDVQRDGIASEKIKKSQNFIAKVIHQKKHRKLDKSDLYTELSTLSTGNAWKKTTSAMYGEKNGRFVKNE
ncbi:MAG: hypothetical protein ACI4SA_01975 [Lachnospiraceae bacterium]